MTGRGEQGGPGSAQDRLTEEARATASALLEWLGSRVDQAAAPGGYGARPAQSPGPCTWCPVCALVAAMRGEQPELTARLAEQASGLMLLLRAMVQAHDGHAHPGHAHPGHAHPGHAHAAAAHSGADLGFPDGFPPPSATPTAPPGWPPEWGEPSWAAAASVDPGDRDTDREPVSRPRRARSTSAPRPTRRPRPSPRPDGPRPEAPATEPARPEREPAADEASAGGARERRAPRPGPRRAPARTTSPRTAAPRPTPRAASMPAPDTQAPAAPTTPAPTTPAPATPAPATPVADATPRAVGIPVTRSGSARPRRASPASGTEPAARRAPRPPSPARPAAPSTTPGAADRPVDTRRTPSNRPHPPVEQIAVRRRPDPGT